MQDLDASTRSQLAALAEVVGLLARHRLDHWLFGGWAVDFWAGRVTRSHHDIDLAVWQDDRKLIEELMSTAGWTSAAVDDPVSGAAFRSGGVLVELTFVLTDDGTRVLIPFAGGPGLWSATPFGSAERVLHGIVCRTVPLSLLRSGKAEPRTGDGVDAAKDLADHAVLAALDPDVDYELGGARRPGLPVNPHPLDV